MIGNFKLPDSMTTMRMRFAMIDEQLIDIIRDLNAFFDDDSKKVVLWLATKNPNFGDIAPLKLIQLGRGNKVVEFVRAAKMGDI